MDVPVPGGTNHLGHTDGPSGSSSSLLSKVKRQFSLSKKTSTSSSSSTTSLNSLREHLPKSLGGTPRGADGAASSVLGSSDVDEPTAYTIAPPDHRENTARHAMMDSLPSFGSLHPPQISLVNPLRGATGPSCFSPDYDSDDDASPPPTPPISAPQSRRPSLNAPPFPRRASDPSSKGPGAGSKSSSSSDPLEALCGNVVQLGGFRGSILRDARTNKRLWIPLKVGFGLRKADLGLGLEDEDEQSSEERIVPGHMLTQISGWIDLGRKLKNEFKQVSAAQHARPRDPLRPPLRYHSFGYDWRRSLQMSSKLLLELLVRLKEESALRGEGPDGQGLGATIIAHSMGGLVALHALASAPDPTVVRGILFAGTPFQGCINTLGAFKLGGGVAFNQKVGNPATVFSWRSGFYFLPRPLPDAERQQAEEELPDLPLPVGDPSASDSSRGDSHTSSQPTTAPSPSSSSPSGSPSTLAPPPPQPPTPRRSLSYPTPAIPLHRLLSGCFETPRGEPLPVDFFDPQSWATYALSPVPAGMDFERPYLRPQPGAAAGANGTGAGGDEQHEHGSNPLSAFGAPGNLGERTAAFPGVNLAGNVEDAVERVTAQLGEAWAQENDADAGEETMRLRRQAREVDTVRRYLARTLERAREFQDDLIRLYDPAKAHLYPPLAVLTSHKTPTVRGVLVTSREHIVPEGYERLLWAEGDGIVLHESAIRLPGDPEVEGRARTGRPEDDKWMVHLQGVVETTHGHVGLLGDLDGVRKGMQLLYG